MVFHDKGLTAAFAAPLYRGYLYVEEGMAGDGLLRQHAETVGQLQGYNPSQRPSYHVDPGNLLGAPLLGCGNRNIEYALGDGHLMHFAVSYSFFDSVPQAMRPRVRFLAQQYSSSQ